MLTPDTKAAIVEDVDSEIQDAFECAKAGPFPEAADWEELNYSNSTPLADRLLVDSRAGVFDQGQADATPKPY
jgi:hypothetical protein